MITDKERLDFLQRLNDKNTYSGKCVLRQSLTNRGWRLHETQAPSGTRDVREAIDNYMKKGAK